MSIAQKTRRGISWNLAGAIATNGMRLVVLAVLGRMLSPDDMGVVALAVSVNAIVYAIRDVGIGPALIQRKELDDGHIATAFAVSIYTGLVLSLALLVCAPWISRSVDVVYALGLLFLLRNVAATSRNMCRREMNFRLLAVIDTASFTIGSIVAIGWAIAWGGPWSLVVGYWVEELIATVAYLRHNPPRWSLRVHRDKLGDLLGFGAGQTVTQVMNVVATYGDNVVVGKTLGDAALGFYTRAFDLVKFPALIFGKIVGTVLFSAFSRIQDDRPRLAANFRRVTFVNALVLLPASAALIVAAPETIRILVGPGWDDAVVPFQILAVTIAVRTNQRLAALVANAAGGVNGVAVAVIVYVIALVGGALLAVRWGIPGVATSTSLAVVILWLECYYLAIRVSSVSVGELIAAHIPGVVLAAVVTVVALPCAIGLRSWGLAAPLTFALTTVAAIGASIALTAVWLRRGHGDFGWLAQELRRFRGRRHRNGHPRDERPDPAATQTTEA